MSLITHPNVSTATGIPILLTLALILLFPFLIRLKRKLSNQKHHLPLPPGPLGLPILGSLPFLKPNLHRHFTGLARSFGPIFSLRLGFKLCVVVSSPSAAREILKTQDAAFANHVIPAAIRKSYGSTNLDILWAPYGPLWSMLRKITVHKMLGPVAMQAVAPLRRLEMRRTVEAVWGRSKMGETIDVRETAFMTALNMMTSLLLGEPVGGGPDEKEFRRAIEEAIGILMAPNVADFFPAVARLDPQGLGTRMKEIKVWIDGYLAGVVEKKKRKLASGERRGDVLEALLDLVYTGNSDPKFTMDDLYKLLMVSC